MKAVLIASIFMLNFVWASEENLTKFKTDYCTNYPEGTIQNPDQWKHCCLIHDMYFWAGGNEQDRDKADLNLRSCVEATGAPKTAAIMYYAVRAGSMSPVKYPDKKWNNGWRERPDFQSLSIADINAIQKEIEAGYDFVTIQQKQLFIKELRSRLE